MPYSNRDKRNAKQREARAQVKQAAETSRRWALLAYPDSLPTHWPEMMDQMHLPIWVSPLHDRDTWTELDEERDQTHKAGEMKKPHYHVMVRYPCPVERERVESEFEYLHGPRGYQKIIDEGAMVRYMVHLDNPEKAQYDRGDALVFGGATLAALDQFDETTEEYALREMRRFVVDEGIVNFAELMLRCDEEHPAWTRILDRKTSYGTNMREFMRSLCARRR